MQSVTQPARSIADRAEAHPILGPILHGACLVMGLALLWLGLVVL